MVVVGGEIRHERQMAQKKTWHWKDFPRNGIFRSIYIEGQNIKDQS